MLCFYKLDVGSINHHLEKINYSDIAIAELQQNAILGHVKRVNKEKKENEHLQDTGYMQGTHTAAPKSGVHTQTGLAKLSIESLAVLPSLSQAMVEKKNYKFNQLPQIELPSFNRECSEWRPYWEKLTNAFSKNDTVTDVDCLSFLVLTLSGIAADCAMLCGK